jgi:hypothetical protein
MPIAEVTDYHAFITLRVCEHHLYEFTNKNQGIYGHAGKNKCHKKMDIFYGEILKHCNVFYLPSQRGTSGNSTVLFPYHAVRPKGIRKCKPTFIPCQTDPWSWMVHGTLTMGTWRTMTLLLRSGTLPDSAETRLSFNLGPREHGEQRLYYQILWRWRVVNGGPTLPEEYVTVCGAANFNANIGWEGLVNGDSTFV